MLDPKRMSFWLDLVVDPYDDASARNHRVPVNSPRELVRTLGAKTYVRGRERFEYISRLVRVYPMQALVHHHTPLATDLVPRHCFDTPLWLAMLEAALILITQIQCPDQKEQEHMRPMEVDVLYVGAAQVECPECGARTKLAGDKLRGVDVTCTNCKVSLYVAEDADIEMSEDELLDADSSEG